MNCNQQRAVDLAGAVLAGRVLPSDVTDTEWALLLLAADLCDELSPPLPVACGVLDQFDHHRGYFTVAGITVSSIH